MKISQKGTSLIETMVYIAAVIILAVLTINTVLIIMKSLTVSRVNRQIVFSAETAMERMTREIKSADEINISASIFDSSPGKLVLNKTDPATGALIQIKFFLDNGNLMIQENAGIPETLTSPKADVVSLIFRQISGATISQAVKIEFEIQSGEGNFQKSEKFYNSIILRESYQ